MGKMNACKILVFRGGLIFFWFKNCLFIKEYSTFVQMSKEKLLDRGQFTDVILTEDESGQRQILKILRQEHGSQAQAGQLSNEYKITKDLKIKGLRRALSFSKASGRTTLTLEHVEGVSLSAYFKEATSIPDFLDFAIKITETIAEMHQKGVIHKDLNPNNILFNVQEKRPYLIDFGIASNFSSKSSRHIRADALEGTLAYMAPEQTGRINRIIDQRSDLYSLGITFYELLTQKLPFYSNDPSELVHAHLAQTPLPPQNLAPKIPIMLSALVQKLLAKSAEERYQSAFGLLQDLNRIQKDHNQLFELAQDDFTDTFVLKQKLYGREDELRKLMSAYTDVCNGQRRFLKIAGYSGAGKSSLVHEIHKPITESNGYFIEGKFDQFKRDIPYFAWKQALKELTSWLLSEKEEQLNRWAALIKDAVKPNGKLLTDLLPQLELIIGAQSNFPQMNAVEFQTAFNQTFIQFLRIIARPEHPLVIFIDDVQWADSASLNLIKAILQAPDCPYILLMVAYRSNEVQPSHPLASLFAELQKTDDGGEELLLNNLISRDVEELLHDALSPHDADLEGLTNLVMQKTQGNAFFVTQFLKTLDESNHLYFDQTDKCWKWNLSDILKLDITDNVVELLIKKIGKMPDKTRTTLSAGACFGNKFDLNVLASILKQSTQDLEDSLDEALQEQLAFRASNQVKFAHDRIQQAFYEVCTQGFHQQMHLQIGTVLHDAIPAEQRQERVFEYIDHLNKGIDLLKPDQKIWLLELNLAASRRAKNATAYKAALNYARLANQLLPPDAWQSTYALALRTTQKIAEILLLKVRFEDCEKIVKEGLNYTKTLQDKIPFYEIQIKAYIAQNNLKGAVEYARPVLKSLGVDLPTSASKLKVGLSLVETKMALMGKKGEDLLNLPRMTDSNKLAAMRIMTSIDFAVYASQKELFPLHIMLQLRLSLKYGNCLYSPMAYATFGGILCGALKQIEAGYELVQTALKMVDLFDAREVKAMTYYSASVLTLHWKEHLSKTVQYLETAIQLGQTTGDLEFASLASISHASFEMWVSTDLAESLEKIKQHRLFITSVKQESILYFTDIYQTMALLLTRQQGADVQFRSEFFEPETKLEIFHHTNNDTLLATYAFYSTFTLVYYNDFEQTPPLFKMGYKYREGLLGLYFFECFAWLEAMVAVSRAENGKISLTEATSIAKNSIKAIKVAEKDAPMNYEHLRHSAEAELARVKQDAAGALRLYTQAIELAVKNNYPIFEAKIRERLAELLLSRKQIETGEFHLKKAFEVYQNLNMKGKTTAMEQTYPSLLSALRSDATNANKMATITRGATVLPNSGGSNMLDLNTIIKASQVLSGEVNRSRLIEKLMQLVLENAGAERGLLFLNQEGALLAEAESVLGGTKLLHKKLSEVGDAASEPKVPESLVNYVFRGQQMVLLEDAAHKGQFTSLPYMKTHKTKSVLCLPLINQGKVSGVLYLENNLSTNFFTAQRVELLNMLSTQIAISLENALLYENLEEKVKERTAEVMSQRAELEKQNHNITASINYAKRIQEAMLPRLDEITGAIPKNFVYFRPRDIVSGDFYWFHHFEDVCLIAAVDCTGHGVPGAFMSLIGNDLLHEIVVSRRIVEPHIILKELHFGVTNSLKQKETDNRDGMDIALCALHKKHLNSKEYDYLTFSGAHNPFVYIQNGILQQVKGSNLSIGGRTLPNMVVEFESTRIDLNVPTSCYIFSDGFQDQFGGSDGRKFMIKRMKGIFERVHGQTHAEQMHVLDSEIQTWKANYKQTDDILVIGFEVGG